MIGTVLPSIFLAVAAFLLNVVLYRLVATQREQIAALKALGYANRAIARHYLQLVVVIVLPRPRDRHLRSATGWAGAVTALYAEFFHFPELQHRIPPWLLLVAPDRRHAGRGGAAARSTRCAPPSRWRRPRRCDRRRRGATGRTLLERPGSAACSAPAMRMIIRNMERRPLRALLTIAGMAAAVAIVISGLSGATPSNT